MKKNILVITGTRAEYGMLRSTMDAIREHPRLELKLLVTGMHTQNTYGHTRDEIVKDGYPVDSTVTVPEGADMLSALAREIEGVREYCAQKKPDCILVLGDRGEMLAGALAGAHLNIPVAHIHGGDVTGTGIDDSTRNVISKLASLHFPGTRAAAERLISMGESPSRIAYVGTPVIDMIVDEALLSREAVAHELLLDSERQWLTVVMHPVAFDDTPLEHQIGTVLGALEKFPHYEKMVLYPNSDTGSEIFIRQIRSVSAPQYHVKESLPRKLYMSVVHESAALIGNSSAGIIETAHLGTPSVDIGPRQDGRERGESVYHAGYDTPGIVRCIEEAIMLKKDHTGPFPSPYGDPGAGKRIAEEIAERLERPGLLNKRLNG